MTTFIYLLGNFPLTTTTALSLEVRTYNFLSRCSIADGPWENTADSWDTRLWWLTCGRWLQKWISKLVEQRRHFLSIFVWVTDKVVVVVYRLSVWIEAFKHTRKWWWSDPRFSWRLRFVVVFKSMLTCDDVLITTTTKLFELETKA